MRSSHAPIHVLIAALLCIVGVSLEPTFTERDQSTDGGQSQLAWPVVRPASLAAQGIQKVTIGACGPCGCDYTEQQCYDKRKAEFEATALPRGEVTGVCFAFRYRYDWANGQQIQRRDSPIFTRVRFNENEVLNSEFHGRDAGFDASVLPVWREFIMTQAPEADGWGWFSDCAVLSNPRSKENERWTRAQQEQTFQRVFMPTYGIADTPEERALEAKLAAERKAKEAEIARQEEIRRKEAAARAAEAERQRLAAEAARKAELARAEAERQRKVDAIAQQLGPGKREAAERLQRMNEELAALRPKPRPVSPATPAPKTNQTSRQCTRPAYTTKWSTGPGLTDLKEARAEYATLATKACQGRGGTVSPIRCGKVVTVLGASFSSCEATISCAAYTDQNCGAKVSPQ